MPIPLGVLAVAGAGAAGATGAYELLESQTLGTAVASLEFSNINTNYGSTYQHLQIRMVARSSVADTANNFTMTFNGVGGTSYASHSLDALYEGGTLAVRSRASTSAASMTIGRTTGANAVANSFGAAIIDILDPFETTKNTTVRALSGETTTSDEAIALRSGLFNNTAAITSIVIDVANDWVIGSRFSLYGLRSS